MVVKGRKVRRIKIDQEDHRLAKLEERVVLVVNPQRNREGIKDHKSWTEIEVETGGKSGSKKYGAVMRY